MKSILKESMIGQEALKNLVQNLTKGGLNLFPPAVDAIVSKIRNMGIKRKRIQSELQKPELLGQDFSPPPLIKILISKLEKRSMTPLF